MTNPPRTTVSTSAGSMTVGTSGSTLSAATTWSTTAYATVSGSGAGGLNVVWRAADTAAEDQEPEDKADDEDARDVNNEKLTIGDTVCIETDGVDVETYPTINSDMSEVLAGRTGVITEFESGVDPDTDEQCVLVHLKAEPNETDDLVISTMSEWVWRSTWLRLIKSANGIPAGSLLTRVVRAYRQ